jgi:hypothetical protein
MGPQQLTDVGRPGIIDGDHDVHWGFRQGNGLSRVFRPRGRQ